MAKRIALKRGDKVGIVAPGAQFNKEKFKTGIAFIKKWGLVPVLDKNIFKKDFIYAGTVEQRVQAISKFIKQKDIKAIWCVRGGYGCSAVAQELGKLKVKGPGKILIGLSDVTALHLVFNQVFKWPTVHGPTVDRMGIDVQSVKEQTAVYESLFLSEMKFQIRAGLISLGARRNVRGILTGGNLSLICSSLGTSWEINTKDKILFLEEIAEPSYRVDRMITQLKNAGKFEGVKAILFGDFTQCKDSDGKERWKTVLKRNFKNSKVPVLFGIKSGHGALRLPLPLGSTVEVRAKTRPELIAV